MRSPGRGDYVHTAIGAYGLVADEAWGDEQERVLLMVEDHDEGEAVEQWVAQSGCRAERRVYGSYEICEAVVGDVVYRP